VIVNGEVLLENGVHTGALPGHVIRGAKLRKDPGSSRSRALQPDATARQGGVHAGSRGKVAVVTGAASGIGRAMARVFGAAGMKVALADVEAGALREARRELAADGVEAAAFACDVSQPDAVHKLAEDARSAFGGVHVVCNNAGVFCGGTSWGTSLNDYEWVLNVNVWGVIHGIRTFVPILLEQSEPAHVVNTARWPDSRPVR
jgi:NAD(P)-dependent dehydrogenase (short-subunit alcohol dehydrogenase family)